MPEVDRDGYTSFSLDKFMVLFAPYMVLGEDMPFWREILIDEKELKDVPPLKR